MRASLKEQQAFVKRLAIATSAGVPLLQSLRMVLQQSRPRSHTFCIVSHLIETVEGGQGLASGLEMFVDSFGLWPISLIAVGESSGSLPEQLQVWQEHIAKQQAVRRQLLTALVYPIFVLVIAIGIVGLLLGFVFPRLLPIFASLKFQLPLSTRILLGMYVSLRMHWWVYIAALLAVGATVWFVYFHTKIKQYAFTVVTRIPVIGRVLITLEVWRIFQCISILLRAEMPLVKTLRTAAACATQLKFSMALQSAAEYVSNGQTLSSFLLQKQSLFPLQATQILSFGEQAGSLSTTFDHVTHALENEVAESLRRLTVLFEPILLVMVGLSVGFIALAIITPIYGITQSLH